MPTKFLDLISNLTQSPPQNLHLYFSVMSTSSVSSPNLGHGRPEWLAGHPRFARVLRDARHGIQTSIIKAYELYLQQSATRKVLIVLAGSTFLAVEIAFIIYHQAVFELVVSFAESWRELRGGSAIMFGLIVLVSFPPLFGYSLLSSMCGIMYGLWGWPLLASATILGSLISFLFCRFIFQDYAQRLARSNERFTALTRTIQNDGFTLLWMIRLCPLPYSLSNGALASISSISPLKFALATAVVSPKLFLHIFVGDRLAHLTSETDLISRLINIVSICLASVVGAVTVYTIYIRTIERAEQIDAYVDIELDAEANCSTAVEPLNWDSFNIEEDNFELYKGEFRNQSS